MTGQWSLTAESGHVSGRESGAANVYVADLSSFVPAGANVYGLRENGNRLIRARYPNANPEFGFGSSLHALSWVPSVLPKEPDMEVRVALCLASLLVRLWPWWPWFLFADGVAPCSRPLPLHVQVNPTTPFRNTSYEFQTFQLGIGGPCQHFTPPAG